jgi:hypothetical protein
MRGLRRTGAILLAAGLALVISAGPASAHDVLESSDPPDGATLAGGPAKVTLTFDLPVQREFATVTVTGPGRTRWEQPGDPAVDAERISVGVRPLGPAGTYTVAYRIVSDDGHPVSGTVRFTLSTAGTGTPAPPSAAAGPPAATGGGVPAWIWLAGAVVVLGVGVAMALRLNRTGPPR